jgi:hypothetical protein
VCKLRLGWVTLLYLPPTVTPTDPLAVPDADAPACPLAGILPCPGIATPAEVLTLLLTVSPLAALVDASYATSAAAPMFSARSTTLLAWPSSVT